MNNMLDRNNLQDEFDMKPLEDEVKDISTKLADDPIDALKDNIDRANDILDILEREMRNGNLSARMAEVSGQLINSVTNASKEIMSGINYSKYLKIREKMVTLKEMEIQIKERQLKKPSSQNIIVTDRESVLRLLEDRSNEEK